ncbi:MAG: UDP-N-acetylmuramoylalanine--D-glutamate ligase [Acidimicrobiales bacterium AG-410-I20]|nr:MAG: UDP-N-acetylmuramoylalanine--D-glutamate ligase [Acidimicrobiales bacterium AG-410-I20]
MTISSNKTAVLGFGITGRAVVKALVSRQERVCVVDEYPTENSKKEASESGGEVVDATASNFNWESVLRDCERIVLSPGVKDSHQVFALAKDLGIPILDEFDLAREWDGRPCTAITGTNGKTTVVSLVVAMLNESGIRTEAAGNTETPFVEAIEDASIERFILESSSFRLSHSLNFSASPAAWLNFAPDHLDIHKDLDAYEKAKLKIWNGIDDPIEAIANLSDPVVAHHAPDGCTSFGTNSSTARVKDGFLVFQDKEVIQLDQIKRRLPHDLENAQAAVAITVRSGGNLQACANVLSEFSGLPHRMEFIGARDGVLFVNDSKATTPHATISSMQAVSQVTLIAGGKNKGVDLRELGDLRPQNVVAIGEASGEIEEIFQNICEVKQASTMREAVEVSVSITKSGGMVLLSPSCSSFDWYASYAERGDDFRSLVNEYISEK